MKISKKALLLISGIILALTVSAFTFVVVKKNKVNEPKIAHVKVQNKDGDNVSETNLDIQMYDNLKDLYANSDYVVRGIVNKKNQNTRNLAKNWQNLKEDSKDIILISQEYTFTVSNWIKGNGEKEINVVYPDYKVDKSSSKQLSLGNASLKETKEYILFLKKDSDSGAYYSFAEPWQFLIQNDKNVKIITSVNDFAFSFDNISVDDLLSKLK